MPHGTGRAFGATLAMLLVAVSAGTVGAEPIPGALCIAPKARAVGRGLAARLGCLGAVASTGSPLDPACVDAANAKLSRAVAKADRRGPCAGTAPALVAEVDDCVSQIASLLPDSGDCSAMKYRAAGKKASAKLSCDAHAAKTGEPADGCLATAEARFDSRVARAERKGPCAGTGTALETAVDDCRTAVRVALELEEAAPECGNGVVEEGEMCDGQSFCTTSCGIQAGWCCNFQDGPFCFDMSVLLHSGCASQCATAGGQCTFGSCVGTSCTDVSIPPTSMCCDGPSGCVSEVVTGSAGVDGFVYNCAFTHNLFDITVGTCGPEEQCVPGG